MKNSADELKLSDIRDALKRLQHMDALGAPSAVPEPTDGRMGVAAAPSGGRGALIKLVLAASCVVGIGLLYSLVKSDFADRPTVLPASRTTISKLTETGQGAPLSDPDKLLIAQQLIREGKVKEARELLLAESADASEDVALALARSYDRNFLMEIPAADAGPDMAEAERWYRSWFEISKKKGLVTDGVVLDCLIRAMR